MVNLKQPMSGTIKKILKQEEKLEQLDRRLSSLDSLKKKCGKNKAALEEVEQAIQKIKVKKEEIKTSLDQRIEQWVNQEVDKKEKQTEKQE